MVEGLGGAVTALCGSCLSGKIINLRAIFEQIITRLKEASVLQNTGPLLVKEQKYWGWKPIQTGPMATHLLFQTVSWL